jgi:hypothetical protein
MRGNRPPGAAACKRDRCKEVKTQTKRPQGVNRVGVIGVISKIDLVKKMDS